MGLGLLSVAVAVLALLRPAAAYGNGVDAEAPAALSVQLWVMSYNLFTGPGGQRVEL